MAVNLASLIVHAVLPTRRQAFLRDERGATAVEVGLLALPFFSIIGAILETSIVFLSGQVLDSAAQDTSRLIRTGQMQSSTIEDFRADMCGRLYGLFDCAKLHIEVQTLATFNAASITPPVNFTCDDEDKDKPICTNWTRNESFTSGAQSSIMVVQVYYKWPIILNLGGVALANLPSGERVLGAATVFRNEPF